MSKEEAKMLFKDVYNEDPSSFKTNFNKIVGQRIYDKINEKQKEILSEYSKQEYSDDLLKNDE
jgi:hypothetical protein